MLELDYQFLHDLFQLVWSKTEIKSFVWSLKGICASVLIIRLVTIVTKDTLDQKKFQIGQNEVTIPITLWTIIRYVGIVAIIGSYDYFMEGIDLLLGAFTEYFQGFDSAIASETINNSSYQEKLDANIGPLEAMKNFALAGIKFLTQPQFFLLQILKGLIWIVDVFLYAWFIGERFFVLLILKLTGPFALCLSLFPGFQAVAYKWLAMYARWFFLIVPYLLVNFIINAFIDGYNLLFAEFENKTSLSMQFVADHVKIPMLIFLVILKYKLYNTGKAIYKELIDLDYTDAKNPDS
ncbi:MAG: hypothetical protein AAGA64_08695 [Bacteroidota bacterium]